jgi:hypothetical protein
LIVKGLWPQRSIAILFIEEDDNALV